MARPGKRCPRSCRLFWVDEQLAGWVDYDLEHDWLRPGQVNVGYHLFPAARGKGYASRALVLLLRHLERDTEHGVATLLIHPENLRSLALAHRLGFREQEAVAGQRFFTRGVS